MSHDPSRPRRRRPPSIAAACALALATIFWPTAAAADHVLVRPGRALFNVQVETTLSTPTVSASIRTDPAASFGLDLRTGIFPVNQPIVNSPVLDYVLTTKTVGKADARSMLRFGPWSRVRPPAPAVVRLFTPAPVAETLATPTPAPTPDMTRLADPALPLIQRVDRQLTLFVSEQQRLVERIPPAARKEPTAVQARIRLLDEQISLYRLNYPLDDLVTSQGLQALLEVRQNLAESGTFAHEKY